MVQYHFDWDTNKERANKRKHGLNFRRASSVFRDPNQISIYDEAHSGEEDRWITMGMDNAGIIQIVVHTFQEISETQVEIRIISARKANTIENQQYQGTL